MSSPLSRTSAPAGSSSSGDPRDRTSTPRPRGDPRVRPAGAHPRLPQGPRAAGGGPQPLQGGHRAGGHGPAAAAVVAAGPGRERAGPLAPPEVDEVSDLAEGEGPDLHRQRRGATGDRVRRPGGLRAAGAGGRADRGARSRRPSTASAAGWPTGSRPSGRRRGATGSPLASPRSPPRRPPPSPTRPPTPTPPPAVAAAEPAEPGRGGPRGRRPERLGGAVAGA